MGIAFLFAIAQIGLALCGGAQTSGMHCSKLRYDSLSALVEVASAPAHRGRFLDADDCSHFSRRATMSPVGFFSFHGRCTAKGASGDKTKWLEADRRAAAYLFAAAAAAIGSRIKNMHTQENRH